MKEFSRSQAVTFTSIVHGSVLKTVLDKDIETTGSDAVRTFNNSNCDDLGCMSRSVIDCKFFSILTSMLRGKHVVHPLPYSRACLKSSLCF